MHKYIRKMCVAKTKWIIKDDDDDVELCVGERKLEESKVLHIPHHVCHSYFFSEVLYEKK